MLYVFVIGSDPGALVPARAIACRLPRARAPMGRDGAWLHGSALAVVGEH